jgi:hypothetical protein
MTDSLPQVEITDQVGATYQYSGTVNAVGISLPTTADDPIDEIGIRCAIDQAFLSRLEFSYDNGINWSRLAVGETREDELRGYITQIKIRAAGSLSTCKYEVIMNRGPK